MGWLGQGTKTGRRGDQVGEHALKCTYMWTCTCICRYAWYLSRVPVMCSCHVDLVVYLSRAPRVFPAGVSCTRAASGLVIGEGAGQVRDSSRGKSMARTVDAIQARKGAQHRMQVSALARRFRLTVLNSQHSPDARAAVCVSSGTDSVKRLSILSRRFPSVSFPRLVSMDGRWPLAPALFALLIRSLQTVLVLHLAEDSSPA